MTSRLRGVSKNFKGKNCLKWLLIFIIQFALQSCAWGQTMVFHSFNFNMHHDSPDAEILDYQYGVSSQYGTYANKATVQRGEAIQQHSISGVMPRGDFLYVKWRIKQSGEVYEDRVDLSTRLPADIKDCGIHFVVKGPQLYVYLIPPPGVWSAGAMRKSATEKVSVYLKQHQIYP